MASPFFLRGVCVDKAEQDQQSLPCLIFNVCEETDIDLIRPDCCSRKVYCGEKDLSIEVINTADGLVRAVKQNLLWTPLTEGPGEWRGKRRRRVCILEIGDWFHTLRFLLCPAHARIYPDSGAGAYQPFPSRCLLSHRLDNRNAAFSSWHYIHGSLSVGYCMQVCLRRQMHSRYVWNTVNISNIVN